MSAARTRKAPTSWRHSRVHPSVVRIDIDLGSVDESQDFLLRGDAHHDNPHSLHDREKEDLDEAQRRGACILDVGDLFCAMGGRADPRRARKGVTRTEHLDAEDYFDSLVKHAAAFYAPYAKSFAMIAHGNHETAVLKNQNTDLTARLIERLNERTGSTIEHGHYSGDIYIMVKSGKHKCGFWLTYFHGSGGGGLMTLGTLAIRRQASWNPMAQVVVCGHIHERWAVEIVRKVPSIRSGRVSVDLESQWHIRTGCYKEEYGDGHGGFHVERGAPPKPVGGMWMRVGIRRDQSGGSDVCRPRLEFTATESR